MRENALEMRLKMQTEIINKMFAENMVSPRTYHYKKNELEKWVKNEREEI